MMELDLIESLVKLKAKKAALEAEAKEIESQADEVGRTLYEILNAQNKQSSATYESVGYAQICKPQIRASCPEEEKENLFSFLKKVKRSDLIKTSVDARSLSGFVGELIEEGKEIPPFIPYYLQPVMRVYDKFGKEKARWYQSMKQNRGE